MKLKLSSDNRMKKRFLHIALCVISLCIGGCIYVFFRPNTYISEFIRSISPITINFFSNTEIPNINFLKYYLSDLLWSFSLYCGLNALFTTKKNLLTNGFLVLLLGALWELAQHKNIIPGTGDLIDILMYVVGIAITLIPNLVILNKQKE